MGLAILVCQATVIRLHTVPSASMEETLRAGDRILVDRTTTYRHAPTPARGDLVVFTGDPAWGAVEPESALEHAMRQVSETAGLGPGFGGTTVKRVIGLPGEVVECCDAEGRLLVDREPLDEPYIVNDPTFSFRELDCVSEPISARCFGGATVPLGHYLVLGDNRGNSLDSVSDCRGAWGNCAARTVPDDSIVGEVRATAWPLGRVALH